MTGQRRLEHTHESAQRYQADSAPVKREGPDTGCGPVSMAKLHSPSLCAHAATMVKLNLPSEDTLLSLSAVGAGALAAQVRRAIAAPCACGGSGHRCVVLACTSRAPPSSSRDCGIVWRTRAVISRFSPPQQCARLGRR